MTQTNILFPPGRLVRGSLSAGRTTDSKGKPLVFKSGAQIGQPRTEFFFAMAFPKNGTTHWNQTDWGRLIWSAGQGAFPQHHVLRDFSWKVDDGDSTEPNGSLRKPCDNEGWPGNWVVKFGGTIAPRVYTRDGANYQQLTAEATAMLKLGGWYVVSGSSSGNNSSESPGVYVNHSMVLFVGHDKEIVVGPDAASVFGNVPTALPPGVSATPVGPTVMPVTAVVPPTPAAPTPTAPTPAAAVPTVPHPAILTPPVPPAPPARVLTAKAGGATYEQLLQAGWTDALLVQHGMMA
jgi:hypothetical protein